MKALYLNLKFTLPYYIVFIREQVKRKLNRLHDGWHNENDIIKLHALKKYECVKEITS